MNQLFSNLEFKRRKLQENTEDISQLLKQILIDNGLKTAKIITGLDTFSLLKRIGKMEYDSEMCYEVIYELFRDNNTLMNQIGNYTLEFNFDGILEWHYRNNDEIMYALCTPFWDGDNILPMDIQDYSLNGEDYDLEIYKGKKITKKFNSVESLISWFNNWYIHTVRHFLDDNLIELRSKFK